MFGSRRHGERKVQSRKQTVCLLNYNFGRLKTNFSPSEALSFDSVSVSLFTTEPEITLEVPLKKKKKKSKKKKVPYSVLAKIARLTPARPWLAEPGLYACHVLLSAPLE